MTASNNEDKERKDNKGKAADRDVPDPIYQMEKDADSDSDSNNESDDEDKEEQEDNDQTTIESLQRKSGFLSYKNGIFGDSKDDQTTKEIRKNANDPRKVTNNVVNFNINPTYR